MDTILIPYSKKYKAITYLIAVGLTICLMGIQNSNLFAKDINTGTYTGITPTINDLIKIQEENISLFNKKIEEKYYDARISEIEKGIKHIRMIRFYQGKPVRINVIEISTDINPNVSIIPSIASNELSSKTKIRNIANKENAIIAINGGYFKPQTGVPLGTLMINKKLYTGPIYDRVALGIMNNGYKMDRVQLNANINTNIGGLKIDNVNQPRMLSTHTIVYTREWGKTSPPTPKYGTQLVVKNGKIIKKTTNSTEIPENGFVIIGPTKNLNKIAQAKNLELDLKFNQNWEDVEHVISGGPYLIKDEKIFVDMTAQKLTAIGGRNPRTAIGYTSDNNLIMLTADGREESSIGLTLTELAYLMKEFGCTNAMNLDGGGSTVMYVKGKIVNRPAQKDGIPLSHALTVKYKNLS